MKIISLTVLLVNCYDVTDRIFDWWISRQTGMKSSFQWHNHLLRKKTIGLLDSLLASMVVMRVSCAIYWKKNLLHLGKLIIYPCFKKAFLHCIECNIKINVICVKIVLSSEGSLRFWTGGQLSLIPGQRIGKARRALLPRGVWGHAPPENFEIL